MLLSPSTYSLRTRAVLLLVAAAALPVAAAVVIELHQTGEAMESTANALLRARAEHLASELDSFHERYEGMVGRLAALPAVRRFGAATPEGRATSRADIDELLHAWRTSDSNVHGLALFDTNGVSIAATEPVVGRSYSHRAYMRAVLSGAPHGIEFFLAGHDMKDIPIIGYSGPILDANGRLCAVSVVYVRAERFWDAVRAQNGRAGAGSFTVVYDHDGIRIAHSFKSEEVFRPGGRLSSETIARQVEEARFGDRTRALLEDPIVADEEFRFATMPREGHISFHARSPANGMWNHVVEEELRTAPWSVFFLVPDETIEAPTARVVQHTVIAGAIIALTALIVGLFAVRTFLRPVRSLVTAVNAMRAGDDEVRVETEIRGDLGTLAGSFNDMARALRERKKALEGANRELAAQNRSLEDHAASLARRHDQDAAVGRALSALARDGTLREVLEGALRELAPPLGAVVMRCYKVTPERCLVPLAGFAWTPPEPPGSAPVLGSACEALKGRRVLVIAPIPEDLDLRFDALVVGGRPRSVALVPLIASDQETGLLAVGSLAASLGEDARKLLDDIALPLALTIARHDLHERTKLFARELGERNEELRAQADALRAQQRTLEAKNEEVVRSNRAKTDFLTNMSHELRTPLNAVIGFADLLREEAAPVLTADQLRYVEDILGSGRHLLGLINSILELVKIESGSAELRREPLEPAIAISNAATAIERAAKQKGVTVRQASRAARRALADPARLHRILVNLLSNAVKFSEPGSHVEIGAEDVPGLVRFWVKDDGPGMTPELVERIFSPFVQGESALVKKHEGTGIGLAIVKRLVEEHGGTIDVKTAPGEGTRFSFSIPASDGEPSAAAPGPAPDEARAPDSPSSPLASARETAARDTVLVIDDDPQVLVLLRSILDGPRYRVLTAATGREGIALAKAERPAAFVVDVSLPDISGLAVVDSLAADGATDGAPVIVVTGSVLGEAERARLRDHGCIVAQKGDLDREMLLAAIERGAARPTRPSDGRPAILVVDDNDLNRELARALLEKAGQRVVVAHDGASALDVARRERPRLIFMDLAMPRMDGFEATRRLKAAPETRDIPVVALTALTMRHDEARVREAGFDGYLAKPIDRDALLESVRSFLDGAGGGAP